MIKPVDWAKVHEVWCTEILLGVVSGLRQCFIIVFSSEGVSLKCAYFIARTLVSFLTILL